MCLMLLTDINEYGLEKNSVFINVPPADTAKNFLTTVKEEQAEYQTSMYTVRVYFYLSPVPIHVAIN